MKFDDVSKSYDIRNDGCPITTYLRVTVAGSQMAINDGEAPIIQIDWYTDPGYTICVSQEGPEKYSAEQIRLLQAEIDMIDHGERAIARLARDLRNDMAAA